MHSSAIAIAEEEGWKFILHVLRWVPEKVRSRLLVVVVVPATARTCMADYCATVGEPVDPALRHGGTENGDALRREVAPINHSTKYTLLALLRKLTIVGVALHSAGRTHIGCR